MATDQLHTLRNAKYLSLTTFRRDGTAVPTPVWFVIEGDHLLVFTGSSTGKVKRIRNNPQVTVAACNPRGVVKGPVLAATATILPASEGARINRLFDARYPVARPLIGTLNRLIRYLRRQPAAATTYLHIALH
jgi:PPOX class probable F420-dependent enzyme